MRISKSMFPPLFAVVLATLSLGCAAIEGPPSPLLRSASDDVSSSGEPPPPDAESAEDSPRAAQVPAKDAGPGGKVEEPPVGERVSLAVGDPISGVGSILGVGDNLVNGECTVAALGVDRQGKHIALTAGHCADALGAIMVKNGLKEQSQGKASVKIGRAKVLVKTLPALDTFNKSNMTDALAIELDAWVDMAPSGLRVEAPNVGDRVFRIGNGFFSPPSVGGTVVLVTENDFAVDMTDAASSGDSGGPVIATNEKALMGIVSRPHRNALDKRIMATRIDAVIAELDRRGSIGAGLTLR